MAALAEFFNYPKFADYKDEVLTKILRLVSLIQEYGNHGTLQLRLECWAGKLKMRVERLKRIFDQLVKDRVLRVDEGCILLAPWLAELFPCVNPEFELSMPLPESEARPTSTSRVKAWRQAKRTPAASAPAPSRSVPVATPGISVSNTEVSNETQMKPNETRNETPVKQDATRFTPSVLKESGESETEMKRRASVSCNVSPVAEDIAIASFSLASLASSIYIKAKASLAKLVSSVSTPNDLRHHRMHPTEEEILEILQDPNGWTAEEVERTIGAIQRSASVQKKGGIGNWIGYMKTKLPDIRAKYSTNGGTGRLSDVLTLDPPAGMPVPPADKPQPAPAPRPVVSSSSAPRPATEGPQHTGRSERGAGGLDALVNALPPEMAKRFHRNGAKSEGVA